MLCCLEALVAYFRTISSASAVSSSCIIKAGPIFSMAASSHPREPCCSISCVILSADFSVFSDRLMSSRRVSGLGGLNHRLMTRYSMKSI